MNDYRRDNKPENNHKNRSESIFSLAIAKYVQSMKAQGIKTIVNMNIYLTNNNLWNQFPAIQRINTYSSGYKAYGVSKEAYSAIVKLYQTEDVVHTHLKKSERVA